MFYKSFPCRLLLYRLLTLLLINGQPPPPHQTTQLASSNSTVNLHAPDHHVPSTTNQKALRTSGQPKSRPRKRIRNPTDPYVINDSYVRVISSKSNESFSQASLPTSLMPAKVAKLYYPNLSKVVWQDKVSVVKVPSDLKYVLPQNLIEDTLQHPSQPSPQLNYWITTAVRRGNSHKVFGPKHMEIIAQNLALNHYLKVDENSDNAHKRFSINQLREHMLRFSNSAASSGLAVASNRLVFRTPEDIDRVYDYMTGRQLMSHHRPFKVPAASHSNPHRNPPTLPLESPSKPDSTENQASHASNSGISHIGKLPGMPNVPSGNSEFFLVPSASSSGTARDVHQPSHHSEAWSSSSSVWNEIPSTSNDKLSQSTSAACQISDLENLAAVASHGCLRQPGSYKSVTSHKYLTGRNPRFNIIPKLSGRRTTDGVFDPHPSSFDVFFQPSVPRSRHGSSTESAESGPDQEDPEFPQSPQQIGRSLDHIQPYIPEKPAPPTPGKKPCPDVTLVVPPRPPEISSKPLPLPEKVKTFKDAQYLGYLRVMCANSHFNHALVTVYQSKLVISANKYIKNRFIYPSPNHIVYPVFGLSTTSLYIQQPTKLFSIVWIKEKSDFLTIQTPIYSAAPQSFQWKYHEGYIFAEKKPFSACCLTVVCKVRVLKLSNQTDRTSNTEVDVYGLSAFDITQIPDLRQSNSLVNPPCITVLLSPLILNH